MTNHERSLLILIPPGSIMPFASNTVPEGYLLCDGSSYSIYTYPYLFQAIGYTFGGSSGYFNVPDTRNRFIRGSSNSRPIGHTEQNKIKAHTHQFVSSSSSFINNQGYNTIGLKLAHCGGALLNKPQFASIELSSKSNDPDFGTEMRPKNVAMSFVIKY